MENGTHSASYASISVRIKCIYKFRINYRSLTLGKASKLVATSKVVPSVNSITDYPFAAIMQVVAVIQSIVNTLSLNLKNMK